MLNISYKAFLYKIKGTGLDKRFREESAIQKNLSGENLDEINSETPENLIPSGPAEKEAFNLKDLRKRVAEDAEKEMIRNTLLETHWNRRRAAQLLRVSYRALHYKIQKYRLDDLERYRKIEDEAR